MMEGRDDAALPFDFPAPPTPVANVYRDGDIVQIIKLQSRPDLNRQRGEVLHQDVTSGRFVVNVARTGERIKIKGSNLATARRLHVSVVSGLSSVAKSSLTQRILASARETGMRVASIVNNSCLVSRQPPHDDDGFFNLPDGCICCNMRDAFVTKLWEFANSGSFDWLLVEAGGYADPMQVAEAFRNSVDDRQNTSSGSTSSRRSTRMQTFIELDTMASVVDGTAILQQLLDDSIALTPTTGSEAKERGTIAQLVLRQASFADIIVVDKFHCLTAVQISDLKKLLGILNPEASVIFGELSDIPFREVLGRGRYMWSARKIKHPTSKWLDRVDGRFEGASNAFASGACASACCALPGAQKENVNQAEISSFTSQCARPFHPGRLSDLLTGSFKLPTQIQRITGTCWVASRLGRRGIWSSTSTLTEFREGLPWWITVPRNRWPEMVSSQLMQKGFLSSEGQWCVAEYGDCHSELTVAGEGLTQSIVEDFFESLCVSGTEFDQGPAAWALYDDALPSWSSKLDDDALYCLASVGAEGILEALCLQGVDTNARNQTNSGTALHSACLKGRVRSIKALLSCSADVNAVAQRGLTPTHLASSAHVVSLLSRYGCNIEALDDNRHTPLHHAAALGKYEVVGALLENRADIDALTNAMETPLHVAVTSASEVAAQVVGLLISSRANIELISGPSGLDALGRARQAGRTDLVDLLVDAQGKTIQHPDLCSNQSE